MGRPMKSAGHVLPASTGIMENVYRKDPVGGNAPRDPEKHQLTANEGERFLRIVSQVARINRHFDLFQLLQGEIQYFIPHQILIGAWGDFLEPHLNLDVISAIAGVRTDRLSGCNIEKLFRRLHLHWLAHERQPLLFDGAAAEIRTYPACGCALHASLQGMRSIVVHGIHDARDGSDSLYLAARADAVMNGGDIERFRFLVGSLIAQIDTAFRRVSGLNPPGAGANEDASVLSSREKEILAWVSEGRTNHEISAILAISTFTVKNHVQRIIKKLGAANRTEAAAKYRQLVAGIRHPMVPHARRTMVEGETKLAAK